ncbi:sigma factor-like helix-turn-helix DNA-binding protein [Paenibacillus macerans]|uniref:sigma factor-like helix-turn-helix DNA-binding protein n=1 Tax=Paenibacillus macerans TaxID=44252 RepID=UPI0020403578|nr:sigma factor-like helix-turn-helix DNA-binding protein [Paenibacillus macerans]MCM3701448.1 RNA polymerase subunit sigma-24 [Paenibacillus macerans]
MNDLLKSYRETLYALQKVKIGADQRRNDLRDILEAKPTNDNKANLDEAQEYCDAINSFISNVLYVVTWLSRGHAPGPRRGIHRRSRQQREVLMDPLKMQSYANPAAHGSPTTISDSERFMIDEAMHALNERERECYVLKYGQCFSERQIASMLYISQQAVNKHIQKAERKINESLKSNLFLQIG